MSLISQINSSQNNSATNLSINKDVAKSENSIQISTQIIGQNALKEPKLEVKENFCSGIFKKIGTGLGYIYIAICSIFCCKYKKRDSDFYNNSPMEGFWRGSSGHPFDLRNQGPRMRKVILLG